MPVEEHLIPDHAHADESESFILIAETFSGLMKLVDEEHDTNVAIDLAESFPMSR